MPSAHEAAGATGTRRSPRPLRGGRIINASGASRREDVNARLKSGIFVGWAKPPGRANARPMTGSACPPFKNDDVDGGHGASAPLPTLRNLIEYERVRHAQPSSPAKAGDDSVAASTVPATSLRAKDRRVGKASACPPFTTTLSMVGTAQERFCPPFCNGPRLVNPFCVVRSPGFRFCTGSAQGRHLMGLEEDRSTNLRSRAHEATWWATA